MSVNTPTRDALLRAALLKKAQEKAARASAPILPMAHGGRAPLSMAQQRLWFLSEMDTQASQASHVSTALRLAGDLDIAVLEQAFVSLMQRHASLRTSFCVEDGVPYQAIAQNTASFGLERRDLRAGTDIAECLAAELAAAARTPFDLNRGPLLRGVLWQVADDQHVLLIVMHHLVTDGWSLGILVRELSELYTAGRQGRAPTLPALPIQYADYAAWQQREHGGGELERQIGFWREHLTGAPEAVELAVDRERPAVRSHNGASLPFALPDALTRGVRALAVRHGMTPYMVLLSSWALWLARHSGEDDIVVGTPVAGRVRREVEGLIGFFVNTLALRVRPQSGLSVAQLLAQVKATTLAGLAHQTVPFERVVEAVAPARSLGRSPLFQTLFALNNTPAGTAVELPGLILAPYEVPHTTTHFDLSLALNDNGQIIGGAIEYASDLFDEATVRRFSQEWQALLAGMAANDTADVWDLSMLSAQEAARLWEVGSEAPAPYPRESLLHEAFESWARRQPAAEAVICGEQRLSYRELDERANRLSMHLQKIGVRAGARVALCLTRGVEMIVAMLGVLKAGACYVPLDPEYPTERQLHILEDSGPDALLYRGDAVLPDGPWSTLDVDGLSWTDAVDVPSRESSRDPEALCCLIYTSGSTGRPKGVMLRHRNLVNLTHSDSPIRIAPGTRIAHAANVAFDAASWEIWGALSHGACLIVVSNDELLDAGRLSALLAGERVEVLHLTVGLFHQHVDVMGPALSRLSALLFGGEKADAHKVRRFMASGYAPPCLVQCYGPTETTTFASSARLEQWPAGARSVPLGKPLANARIYLLDRRGEPVPEGVVGEIYIGGEGVSAGYWRQDAMTAERFLPDPRGSGPGARMYRTGDLARRYVDGRLEYVGRTDFQVKIRGFRIELGEIEARLAACPGVREAVVLAREDQPGQKRLVAYVIAQDGVSDVAALGGELSRQLPDYMVPSAFVRLDAFPLTANGKLDRKALPAPDRTAMATREYEAPQGEIEQTLAGIWQTLLNVERVGRHDHFFELGGHSLLVVQLVSHVRDALGVEVALRELFLRPTLQAFAEVVPQAAASTLGRIEAVGRERPLPLSLSQQRLWFIDQLDAAASRAYHMPTALRLSGRLNRVALQAALDRLVARQESLRVRIVAVDGVPHQAFAAEDVGFVLVEQDLRNAPEQERRVIELATEEASAPFDFTHGPLIRGRLLQLADEEHVLLVTQHHIVSDGWSLGVMVREFAALYTAFCEGRADPLPPLAIQYADYAVWQRGWLQGEQLERQVAFWRDHLTGAPAVLELPTDRPRPPVQSHQGGQVAFELSAEHTAKVRALAQRHGTTLFTVMLAGWSLLLGRMSGQDDVVVGTPVANRQRREIEGLIGFFVNTLALRVRFDGQVSVAQLLAQVKETALAAFAHQELPFEQVVEAVQPTRSLSHSPLFQAMLTMNNTSDNAAQALPGLTLSPVQNELTVAQFDLSLSLNDDGRALRGVLKFACDLFDRATVERLAGHFVTLLEGMAADDTVTASTLPLMTREQRRQVLDDFNATAAEYPKDALVHAMFEQQASRLPDALALVYENSTLRYGELESQANRLAHELIVRGVRPDARVAICVERSIDMVVGLLAILKAGGAYVPLDPEYPLDRLAFMLADSAPTLLLTPSSLRDRLPAHEVPTLHLDQPQAWASRPDHRPEVSGLTSRHLAYVIYTSGSTGRPKGVAVEHRSALNLAYALARQAYGGTDCVPGLRVGMNASLAFDGSVKQWLMLTHGATLYVIPEKVRRDGAALRETIERHGLNALDCTPAQLSILLPAMAGAPLPDYLLIGGDRIDQALWKNLQLHPGGEYYNVYGPTEVTVDATICRIDASVARPSIGRPLSNVRVYLLDAQRQPVPIGVAGEIYVGGDGVARGYLNRPELTAERFLRDPFVADGSARMYRTGDLGRWLPAGTIEFLGRNDFQVKIRGFRIELGEIEARLAACAGVREAVVLAREDQPGDKRLVAYLIAHENGGLDVAALREALLQQLPEHMLPSAFVRLDAFPLTPNGKLDRKALPAPDGTSLVTRVYEVPQGEVEETLAGIWQTLLNVERVGRHDHFFELGGHSLLAVQLVSHVRDALGVEVALRELFVRPTLQAFAEMVPQAAASTLGRIEAIARDRPLPLSLAQQRLWFIGQLDEAASRAYHMPTALRLSGRLDRSALQATLDRLVARQEGLRTRFVSIDGVPHQAFAPADVGFVLVEHDLRNIPEPERRVTELATEEAAAPFDFTHGPLIRGRLLTLADEEHVLLVTQHHIVSDGWSQGVMVREFTALYTAFCEGRADPLPPLAIQYADYAVWQRGWLQGEQLERQVAFWRDHLTGAPAVLELPTDRPRPAVQSYQGAQAMFALSPEQTAKVRALAKRHGTTLFTVMLAGWSLLLGRMSGQDDVVVGTPVANRQRREVEGLLGFFANTLALRVRLDGQVSVAQLLAQVKETALAAFAHQELPFEQVVEAVQPTRSLSHSPLFQVTLSLNNAPTGATQSLPGLTLSSVASDHSVAQFDLSLLLHEGDRQISGSVIYAKALFDHATIERMTRHFVLLLDGMASDEAAGAMRLPLLSGQQRRQLLGDFNDTAMAYPRDALVHELFERQAASQPDAAALVDDEQILTYAALNARANRLAHALISRGVRPDDRVAICAERGIEMVVGLLAILKAGGAYVPLDPAYPVERLAFMLGDSAPVALLIQSNLRECLPIDGELAVIELGVPDFDEQGPLADHNPGLHAAGLAPNHLAYVIYTSGSTGMPKGVMVEHRQLVNLAYWHRQAFDLREGQRTSSVAGVGFDAAAWEIWPTLLSGATLALAPAQAAHDPDVLLAWWTRQQFAVSFLPTPLAEFAFARGLVQSQVGTLLIGGDRLRQMPDGSLQLALVNNYGPTETTVVATSGRLDGSDGAIHIGRPIANTRIYILDAQGEPVPVGVPGEIHIGGDGVARGYLNRPELTAERFLRDPFAGDAQARMYKTGDLGRWLPDGNIEYLGRNDFQVKIRGFRIELGEIETRLAACAGVREAVVLAREDQAGEKRLVAYVVAENEDAALDVAALREALLQQLPEHMLPSAFVRLDAFPLTPNGKLDRKALPAPDASAMATREYEAPQGEIEQTLAALWQTLLNVERVGRHDHFFELGGHSLLAVQLISHVRDALGVEVALRELFVRPTLQAFAEVVPHAAASTLGRIEAIDRDRPLPLSLAQQRLWFIDQLDAAASRAYHMPIALRLSGRLQRLALKAALDGLVARQEGLRTHFVSIDGVPHQAFAPADVGFALVEQDLRDIPSDEQEQHVTELAAEEAGAPFDFTHGPLIRGRLLRLSDEEHVLLVTQHHIVSDGWSQGVMVREFTALYTAFCEGRADPLPPLAIQYADYAVWQRGWLQGEQLERQVAFWRDHLTGAPAVLELPTDRPRPAVQSYQGAQVMFELSPAQTAKVRALAQRHGTTLFTVVLAGWSLLLGRMSGQDDVVIGTSVANRQRREVEGLIGFFVNTLALRVRLDEQATVAELLQQVKDSTLAAFAHQELPFEQVVEALQPVRSLSHSPLFQVMLTLNHAQSGTAQSLPGLTLSSLQNTHTVAQFDLSLSLNERSDGLYGTLEFACDLFDHATIERLAGHFVTLLDNMAAEPSAALCGLALMTPAQRESVIEEFNATAMAYPTDATLHSLIERQAGLTPHAMALVHESGMLSYAELESRANRLAHELLARGVRPDDRVAICVERGIAMVVGLLAILKAGGAYVPLDPAYPADRLAFMLADSAPVLLLTQSSPGKQLPAHDVPVLRLDQPLGWAARPDTRPQVAGLSSHHLAYVIYTSGSTGMPKGVMVEHRNVCHQIAAVQVKYDLGAQDRLLQFGAVTFDMSVEEIFGALCTGAALVLRNDACLEGAASLWAFCRQHKVSVVDLPTRFWQTLVEAGSHLIPAHVRLIIIGGEAVAPGALAAWFGGQEHPARLINTYGPTETTVNATMGELTADPASWQSIGGPVPNATIHVLDTRRQPLPIGVVGEIYIGGAGVARGYLNRPELTAERFVKDPFSSQPGARMYCSGDLGRRLADGSIEFRGRNDFQVKIRGFRIELGEIEARLGACAGVRESVVLMREDQAGDKRLVAYVIAEGAATDVAALRSHMLESLPDYMVPSAFVMLDAFPLTPNGKLDRKALPAPDSASMPSRVYEAPRGEIERTLADIWQKLLNVERVGRHDHFFELGGHSLLAVQLVSQVRERLGMEMMLRDLFLWPTLAALVEHMTARDASRPWSPLIQLQNAPGKPALYMVPGVAMTAAPFRELAKALAGQMNLHFLESRGLEEGQEPCASLDEIVAINLASMREAGIADDPIVLAGHSFGGTVAFEMARKLELEGREVHLLLLDNVLVVPRLLRSKAAAHELAQVAPADGRLLKLMRAQEAIYKHYKPSGLFRGNVDVIYAREGEIVRMRDAARLGSLRTHCAKAPAIADVAGDHRSMLAAPHVVELANAILFARRRVEPASVEEFAD